MKKKALYLTMSLLNISSRISIDKGWSGDCKYRIVDDDGRSYLLRISPAEKAGAVEELFKLMQQIAGLGIPMCRPVEYGTGPEGSYSIYTWIDGKDAEEVIPALAEGDQYFYGFQAGKILKLIHSIPAPDNQEDWESRFNRKIDRKIELYADSPLKYDNGQYFLDYIAANRYLLKGRPQTFQHGDYHIGNMMVDTKNQFQIIDFDRYDFGDPWEEFNRIVWSARISGYFASGIIDGYFDQKPPMEFWKLLALYISINTLSSIPWAIPFGTEQIEVMEKLAAEVLAYYDNMNRPVPSWYCGSLFTI